MFAKVFIYKIFEHNFNKHSVNAIVTYIIKSLGSEELTACFTADCVTRNSSVYVYICMYASIYTMNYIIMYTYATQKSKMQIFTTPPLTLTLFACSAPPPPSRQSTADSWCMRSRDAPLAGGGERKYCSSIAINNLTLLKNILNQLINILIPLIIH